MTFSFLFSKKKKCDLIFSSMNLLYKFQIENNNDLKATVQKSSFLCLHAVRQTDTFPSFLLF